MSPAKRPAKGTKKRSGGKKRGKKSQLPRKLGLAALFLVVAALFAYLAYDYHAMLIRDEVQTLVGDIETPEIELRVGSARDGENLMGDLRALARRSFGSFRVEAERRTPEGVEAVMVLRDGRYGLTVTWEEAPQGAKEGGAAPLLAVVIDDLGQSEREARDFLDLPFPVTPAVLPYLADSEGVAREAARRRRPYLLHMPMEPRDYPERNPGEGAVLIGMNEAEVDRALTAALDTMPGVAGVNNHMGSRATADREIMIWVAGELARRDLLFLDSRTDPQSAIRGAVAKAGGRYTTRDVFLDNERTVDAIRARLDEAARLAHKRGHAVAIGHPHPETLAALRAFAPELKRQGITVVPVTRLAERLGN